ncbi:MAG: hypothetical protein KDD41_07915 [Flavobacteriales bacterium]|nr:hypothetical protein [Flavobacteriales bacterium]
MKILYIPADNISANFSRSYHIAKNLSTHCELYRIVWADNRSAFWKGKNVSSLNGLRCFLKSLFQKTRIVQSNDFGFEVYTSVFISAFIGRLVGKYRALIWMRRHNLKSLKKVYDKIQPDLIFHADGYYFFPALQNNIPEYADLQDDINWNNIPAGNLTDARRYYTDQFRVSRINFIVSESAKKSVTEHITASFEPISNGADFAAIAQITSSQKEAFRKKYRIAGNKKIASYIGGAHKFDLKFTEKLLDQAARDLPDLLFVLAGNIPVINKPNAVFTGILPNEEANVLYAVSDLGLTLKNTADNDFIYNSVPLKFVQYAAARKPIVTFPVKWSVDAGFPNIVHINNEDVETWTREMKLFLENFEWKTDYDLIWEKYDWKNIGKTIFDKLKK